MKKGGGWQSGVPSPPGWPPHVRGRRGRSVLGQVCHSRHKLPTTGSEGVVGCEGVR